MSFHIDHPDWWIGVPEHWPFVTSSGTALDPEAWIADLADTLPEAGDLDGQEHLRQVLMLAMQRGVRMGVRMFVGFEEYRGPGYVVESGVIEAELPADRTLLDYAGLDDETQKGTPFAEEFTTASGLVGVRCYRYLAQESLPEALMGRVDYLFRVGRSILFLRGAELDLVSFERLKHEIELLAATVSWRED